MCKGLELDTVGEQLGAKVTEGIDKINAPPKRGFSGMNEFLLGEKGVHTIKKTQKRGKKIVKGIIPILMQCNECNTWLCKIL